MRQGALAEKEREITSLKKQLGVREEEVGQLTSDNLSLVESQDGMKMQLAQSQRSVERLERERMEAIGEFEQGKTELMEERQARRKEKRDLERDNTQLQRKVSTGGLGAASFFVMSGKSGNTGCTFNNS